MSQFGELDGVWQVPGGVMVKFRCYGGYKAAKHAIGAGFGEILAYYY